MRRSAERLSSGGAVLNSVRLSLLLACTAVCAAPGLLPVAGFPHGIAPRTLMLGDNASSIKSETNGSDNDGSKHVDVMAHYVRERMRAGDLHYTYVATNENIADCMTKNNYYPAFKKFRAAMGVA